VENVPIRHAYEEPNCFWQATMEPETGSYAFEIMLYLWEFLYPDEAASTKHIIEPGQSMGIGLWVPDRDAADGETISLGFHFAAPSTGDNLARLEILPLQATYEALGTAVESETWGAIKTLF
jgi:hypothetical protein